MKLLRSKQFLVCIFVISFFLLVGLRFVGLFIVLPVYDCAGKASQSCSQTLSRADTQADVLAFVNYVLIAIFIVSLALLIWKRFKSSAKG
jgi:hypothetical protein